MELEVGVYVRTKKGSIAKLLEFKKNYTKGKRKIDTYMTYEVWEVEEHYVRFDKYFVSDYCEFLPSYPSDEEWEKWKSNILKASHNIIDLIEVGDYVNGSKVVNKYTTNSVVIEKEELIQEDDGTVWNDCIEVNVKDIKSILTKEQYEANCYKVVE